MYSGELLGWKTFAYRTTLLFLLGTTDTMKFTFTSMNFIRVQMEDRIPVPLFAILPRRVGRLCIVEAYFVGRVYLPTLGYVTSPDGLTFDTHNLKGTMKNREVVLFFKWGISADIYTLDADTYPNLGGKLRCLCMGLLCCGQGEKFVNVNIGSMQMEEHSE